MTDDTTVRSMHAAAARALDAAGVRWCRLRPRDDGPEDDLLVAKATMPSLDTTLATAGFGRVERLGRGTHREYHAVHPGSGRWAKLDVVTRIDLGPYQEVTTDLATGFLARHGASLGATPAGPAPDDTAALQADDAFWALLLHELWDRPVPGIRRGDALRSLAHDARDDGPAARAVAALLPRGTAPAQVLAMARASDTDGLLRVGRRMRRRPRPVASIRRIVHRLARWIDRRDPPFVRRGLSVALLGPDGAGKSTLSASLAAGGPLPVRAVYLGLYGGRRGLRARRLPVVGFLGRVFRMWRGWLIGRVHVARGRLVVFDRHPYDARLVTPGSGRRPMGRRLLARSLPPPDLVIVLDAPAEVLFARKADHPMERLAAQRSGYLALAASLPGAVVVDVDRAAEAVERDVAAIVWRRRIERSAHARSTPER